MSQAVVGKKEMKKGFVLLVAIFISQTSKRHIYTANPKFAEKYRWYLSLFRFGGKSSKMMQGKRDLVNTRRKQREEEEAG